MTWRRAVADGLHTCGSCGKAIGVGELVAVTRSNLERCEDCGRKIEDPPETVAAEVAVPPGIQHQASLGFGERNRRVSSGEIARRHVARHIERRGRR